jgi:hypothetical protein
VASACAMNGAMSRTASSAPAWRGWSEVIPEQRVGHDRREVACRDQPRDLRRTFFLSSGGQDGTRLGRRRASRTNP